MIRPATVDDVPRLVEMGGEFLRASPYAAFFAESRDQMTALATQLVTGAQSTILVAEEQGRVIGMLGLVASPHFLSGDMMAGEVFWWMDPTARGAGIRLLRAGEQWARERGATALQMIAPDDRVGHLYERFGYQPIERSYIRRLDAA